MFRSRCGPNGGRLRCGCGNPLDRVWQQHLHNSHPTPAALNSCDGVNRGLVVKQLPAVTVSLQILSSSCQLLQQRVQAVVTVIRGEPFGSRCFCGGLWPDTGAATTNSFKKLSEYILSFLPYSDPESSKKNSYKRFFYVFLIRFYFLTKASLKEDQGCVNLCKLQKNVQKPLHSLIKTRRERAWVSNCLRQLISSCCLRLLKTSTGRFLPPWLDLCQDHRRPANTIIIEVEGVGVVDILTQRLPQAA